MGGVICYGCFGKFISSSRCCSTLDLAHSIKKVQHYASPCPGSVGLVRSRPINKGPGGPRGSRPVTGGSRVRDPTNTMSPELDACPVSPSRPQVNRSKQRAAIGRDVELNTQATVTSIRPHRVHSSWPLPRHDLDLLRVFLRRWRSWWRWLERYSADLTTKTTIAIGAARTRSPHRSTWYQWHPWSPMGRRARSSWCS